MHVINYILIRLLINHTSYVYCLNMALPVTRTVSSSSQTRGNLVPIDKGAVILDIGHIYTRSSIVLVIYVDLWIMK